MRVKNSKNTFKFVEVIHRRLYCFYYFFFLLPGVKTINFTNTTVTGKEPNWSKHRTSFACLSSNDRRLYAAVGCWEHLHRCNRISTICTAPNNLLSPLQTEWWEIQDQALLKAKYSPRVAAASRTQKNNKKPTWPWPLTLKFNRVLALVEVHVSEKFHQAKCSGSLAMRNIRKLEIWGRAARLRKSGRQFREWSVGSHLYKYIASITGTRIYGYSDSHSCLCERTLSVNTSLRVFQWRALTLIRVLYKYGLPVNFTRISSFYAGRVFIHPVWSEQHKICINLIYTGQDAYLTS